MSEGKRRLNVVVNCLIFIVIATCILFMIACADAIRVEDVAGRNQLAFHGRADLFWCIVIFIGLLIRTDAVTGVVGTLAWLAATALVWLGMSIALSGGFGAGYAFIGWGAAIVVLYEIGAWVHRGHKADASQGRTSQ